MPELPPRHIVFALLIPDYSSIDFCEFFCWVREKAPETGGSCRTPSWRAIQGTGNGCYSVLLRRVAAVSRSLSRHATAGSLIQWSHKSRRPPRECRHADKDKDTTATTVSEILEIWDLGAGSGRDVCFLAFRGAAVT
jgi:hypothetical protein